MKTVMIGMFLALALYLWYSLGQEIKSGKPLPLDHKWYQCTEVQQP